MACLAAAGCCLIALLAGGTARAASSSSATAVPARGDGRVLVAPLVGGVDPVMLEFTTWVLDRAERDEFDAVVFELDTPGGLSTSMDEIVREIATSPLPVFVYVAASSARAASAGVFITYAADVAAMAPGTNIGSATPITSGGEQLPDDLRHKVINDAVASITELADERGRDPGFAEFAIREAENIGAREALARDVVDHIAVSVRGLLEQADGQVVQPKDLQLKLGEARVERMELPLSLRALQRLVDPDLLLVLFGLGVVGIAIELAHPGLAIPGVAGACCLLLSLFGMSVLPASSAGIALLVLAAALLTAESIAPGGGILGASGAVALLLGALLLFDDRSGYAVSLPLAVVMSGSLFAFFGILMRSAFAARRLAPTTGVELLIGREALVRRAIGAQAAGVVLVDGELWSVQRVVDEGEELLAGERVQVTAVEGMQVRVRRPDPTGPADEERT